MIRLNPHMKVFLFSLLMFCFIAPLQANNVPVMWNDSSVIQLSDLEVSAERRKQFSEIGKIVSITHADAIGRQAVQHIDVMLKGLPGVDVRQRGVGATQSDISIRGGSFDQVLVMMNGINITDPQTGHHNMNIPVDVTAVSRVEVLKGAASRRFGSQAFSGAVNIVTSPSQQRGVSASVSAGSFGTQSQQLSAGARLGALNSMVSFSRHTSDGYRENTDYNMLNLFSHTDWQTANAGKFDLQLAWQSKSFGANSFYTLAYPNQFEHTATGLASLKWEKRINDFAITLQGYRRRHYDRFELFRDFVGAAAWYSDHNYHLTHVTGGMAQAEYQSVLGKLTSGIEMKHDHIYSTVLGTPIGDQVALPMNPYEKNADKYFTRAAERLHTTGFVDYTNSWRHWYFSAGTSLSHSADFGYQWHYGGDISYFFSNDLSGYVAYNTASRLPTFTDLYYQSATQRANPHLQPESSVTTELGLHYQNRDWQVRAGVFHREGKNIIDWVLFPGEAQWQSLNMTGLATSGADVSVLRVFNNQWLQRISLAYAFINTDKQAEGFDSKYALDYLRHQVVLQLHHQVARKVEAGWTLMLNDRAGGFTEFGTGNIMNYDPYLLVNARVAWHPGRWTLFVDLNNLLYDDYVDFGGLPMPGTGVMAGVKIRL